MISFLYMILFFLIVIICTPFCLAYIIGLLFMEFVEMFVEVAGDLISVFTDREV